MKLSPSCTAPLIIVGLPVFLSACAATQQSLARDDADRLFLKYVEITGRPSPITLVEMEEVGTIQADIVAGTDYCAWWKSALMLKVELIMIENLIDGGTVADIERRNAEARQELKRLETAPIPTQYCAGHSFPQVTIN